MRCEVIKLPPSCSIPAVRKLCVGRRRGFWPVYGHRKKSVFSYDWSVKSCCSKKSITELNLYVTTDVHRRRKSHQMRVWRSLRELLFAMHPSTWSKWPARQSAKCTLKMHPGSKCQKILIQPPAVWLILSCCLVFPPAAPSLRRARNVPRSAQTWRLRYRPNRLSVLLLRDTSPSPSSSSSSSLHNKIHPPD